MNPCELLFKDTFGHSPSSLSPIPPSGSSRQYFRLADAAGNHAIGCIGSSAKENRAFCRLSRSFRDYGVNTPAIYAQSADSLCYLQQDLGALSLLDVISDGEVSRTVRLLSESIEMLVRMQSAPAKIWEPYIFEPPFGRRQILWDLNYFKYEFLKPSSLDFDESALEDDFEQLIASLLADLPKMEGFMMRDCQSRNIMVDTADADKVYFIDFQGGRRGPAIYDLVSLLFQAKAALPDSLRRRMIDLYAEIYSRHSSLSAEEIKEMVPRWAVIRLLQTLGAYGFRGLVEHKSHFLTSIPAAMRSLVSMLERGYLDSYPSLKEACRRLTLLPRFKGNAAPTGRLRVDVCSFSYRRGYPEDLSGNGGGFVFDCRAMHNPGRYDEYKQLTGLDLPVIRFLEERGEVQRFVDGAYALTAPSLERYLQRGFSSLKIAFGCTGGRHRSAYCAEHLAARLAKAFPEAEVVVSHREKDNW